MKLNKSPLIQWSYPHLIHYAKHHDFGQYFQFWLQENSQKRNQPLGWRIKLRFKQYSKNKIMQTTDLISPSRNKGTWMYLSCKLTSIPRNIQSWWDLNKIQHLTSLWWKHICFPWTNLLSTIRFPSLQICINWTGQVKFMAVLQICCFFMLTLSKPMFHFSCFTIREWDYAIVFTWQRS